MDVILRTVSQVRIAPEPLLMGLDAYDGRLTETRYQIDNTGAKVMLVDPLLLKFALEAADKAKFPRDCIFLFSDDEYLPTQGLKDWRTMLASAEESEKWQWESFNAVQSKNRTAVLNYSSGYVTLLLLRPKLKGWGLM